MADVERQVREALEGRVYDALLAANFVVPSTGTPAIDWPDIPIDVSLVEEYVRFSFQPFGRAPMTLGRTPRVQWNGLVHTDVFVRLGTGEDRASDILDLLADSFPYGAELTRGGVSVRIGTFEPRMGARHEGWFYKPAQADWTVWRAT